MVWTKEQKREYNKQYYKDNKEKRREQKKQWYKDNKEKIKEHKKANRVQQREYMKQYYLDNHDKKMIYDWKRHGVICNDFPSLYERYITTLICDICAYPFDETNIKNLDHDHDSGVVRFVLCHRCNIKDAWIKILKYQNYHTCLKFLNK